jgi:hypothetical protein
LISNKTASGKPFRPGNEPIRKSSKRSKSRQKVVKTDFKPLKQQVKRIPRVPRQLAAPPNFIRSRQTGSPQLANDDEELF